MFSGAVDSQYFGFPWWEQNVLHLQKNFRHNYIMFWCIEHIMVRLVFQFIGNVFKQCSFAIAGQYFPKIEMFDHRYLLVNLRQQVFIHRCERDTADKLSQVGTFPHFVGKFNDRVFWIVNGIDADAAHARCRVVKCPGIVNAQCLALSFAQVFYNMKIAEYLPDELAICFWGKYLIQYLIRTHFGIIGVVFEAVEFYPIFKYNFQSIFKFLAEDVITFCRSVQIIAHWKAQESGLIRDYSNSPGFGQFFCKFFQILVREEIVQLDIEQIRTVGSNDFGIFGPLPLQ